MQCFEFGMVGIRSQVMGHLAYKITGSFRTVGSIQLGLFYQCNQLAFLLSLFFLRSFFELFTKFGEISWLASLFDCPFNLFEQSIELPTFNAFFNGRYKILQFPLVGL